MNEINTKIALTSNHIATLTGMSHEQVLADIYEMFTALDRDFEVKDHYTLNEELTLTLCMGYPITKLKVIIDCLATIRGVNRRLNERSVRDNLRSKLESDVVLGTVDVTERAELLNLMMVEAELGEEAAHRNKG